MITLVLLASPEDIYMRILLVLQTDKDSAIHLFETYKDSLPDSLKLLIITKLGYDLENFLKDRISSGTADPTIWKTYLYSKVILNKMSKKSAREFIDRYKRKFEDIPEVLNFAGEILENYGFLDDAKKFYSEALKKGYEKSKKNLAIIYAKLGECDSSLNLFSNLKTEDEDEYERRRIYLSLGVCYEKINDYSQALNYYQKAYEIRKDTLVGFKIAYILARRNGDDALVFLANMYEDLGFSRPNLYWGYALVMSRSIERVKEGIREIGEYLALRGDDARARNILMHGFLRFADTLMALKHANRAYELEPEDDDYRLAYLMLLSSIEENPRKFGYLLKEKDKKNPLGKLIFARYYRKLGDKWKASQFYDELVEIDPKNTDLMLEAYFYFKGIHDLNRSLKVMKKLVENYPDSLGYWFEIGDIYLRMKKADSIYSLYKNLLNKVGFKLKDCDRASVLNNWAYTMALLKYKLDTAKILIDEAYRLCENEYILDSKGWIYFLLGNVDNGKLFVKKALEEYMRKNRTDPEVLLHFSIILCLSERSDTARSILKETWRYLDKDYRKFYEDFIRMCK